MRLRFVGDAPTQCQPADGRQSVAEQAVDVLALQGSVGLFGGQPAGRLEAQHLVTALM